MLSTIFSARSASVSVSARASDAVVIGCSCRVAVRPVMPRIQPSTRARTSGFADSIDETNAASAAMHPMEMYVCAIRAA